MNSRGPKLLCVYIKQKALALVPKQRSKSMLCLQSYLPRNRKQRFICEVSQHIRTFIELHSIIYPKFQQNINLPIINPEKNLEDEAYAKVARGKVFMLYKLNAK